MFILLCLKISKFETPSLYTLRTLKNAICKRRKAVPEEEYFRKKASNRSHTYRDPDPRPL